MRDIDVLKVAVPESRKEPVRGIFGLGGTERVWYVVDPAVMYPLMISWIRERIKSSKPPEDGTQIYYRTARTVDLQGWVHALLPKDETPAQYIQDRATALEVARLWFTKMLHNKIGGGSMGLHILANDKYKL